MASDLRITDVVAQAMLDAFYTTCGDSGVLRIYVGALTAGSPVAPAGDLLAELTMNATAFGAAAPATTYVTITAGAITADSSANASGNAGSFVLWDSAGTTAIMGGTVAAADADMIIDNIAIAAGATVSCSAFTISLPKGWSS